MQQNSANTDTEEWTLVIEPKSAWFDLHLGDLWKYRDLLSLFVKRDFISIYKQTILGPLWYIINPLLTTFVFTIIFNRVVKIPTDEVPPALFYLSGLVIWNYFSTCLINTSNTLTENADLFGKVYFPRMIVPISSIISALIKFGIQLAILLVILGYYIYYFNSNIGVNSYIFFLPILVSIIGALGLGWGLIVSTLTIKYRDLSFLVSFGLQLLMYATPIIYPLSFIEARYKILILINPITPIVEMFRYSLVGQGEFNVWQVGYSIVFTCISLFIGILIFNKSEKSYMDIV